MAFQADGSAVVNLANPIVLPSATAWTWTMRLQKSSDSEMVAGKSGNARPFIGFFNGGVPSVRFDTAVSGTATFSLTGTYTVGEYYDFVLSHDGAGTITFSVGAASTTLPQNADITIDVFLDYGSFTIPYSGITEGNWVFTGAVGGNRTYNWDQPEGTTTLVEETQALNETITGITTGGFLASGGADTTVPVITLIGDNPDTVVVGGVYTDPGANVTDNVDPNTTVNGVGTIDTSVAVNGQTLTYDYTDAAGNPAVQVVRTVNVVEAGTGTINITSIADFECRKRDENGQATFTVAGTITDGVGPLEVSVGGGAYATLDVTTGTSFSGDVVVTDQQDIVVRLVGDNAVTTTIQKATAALVIVDGPSQSNGAGRGTNLQAPTFDPAKPLPIMWKQTGGFTALADPTGIDGSAAGSMWPHIAKIYSDAGIPVCVCNVAQGGSQISQWQPGGSYYGRIVNAGNALGGISFVTSVIGETDSDLGTTTAVFKAGYQAIVDQLVIDFDTLIYATYFPVGDTTGAGNPAIRLAYDELIAENDRVIFGGDLSTIDIDTTTATGNDGLHIIQDADLITAAGIRHAAFIAASSLLTISMTGIPDGTYSAIYFEIPDVGDVDLSLPVGVAVVTASGGSFSIVTPLLSSTGVVGLLPGATPPSTGGAFHGVTV